jgi:hypothetical protein
MKLVQGVGINDAGYRTKIREELPKVNGNRKQRIIFECPFYKRWTSMFTRCYNKNYHKKYPSYMDCVVCIEWQTFSNFRRWMVEQNWEGNDLDKDLLVEGNKIYGPEFCVFIPNSLNKFMTDSAKTRGEYPLGVTVDKDGYIISSCMDPFNKGRGYLGTFSTTEEAHLAWKKRKHELSCKLAEQQTDPRVAEALRTRYIKK